MQNSAKILFTSKIFDRSTGRFALLFVLALAACRTARPGGPFDGAATPRPPDYSLLENWAAHPAKTDPADRIPRDVHEPDVQADAPVDVFFLHPTIYGRTRHDGTNWNASLSDETLNNATDASSILFQASIFNAAGRVYAPRYRQAHLRSFYRQYKTAGDQALDTAYSDVLAAFDHFLANENRDRPFILAGHSQGGRHILRLLRERVEGTALQNRLVVAYIAGWPVAADALSAIPPCRTPDQTGCYCSWRTWERRYARRKADEPTVVCTNPLLWTIDEGVRAPDSLNRGAVVRDFDDVYPGATDAEVYRGFLLAKHPKFPGSFLFLRKNYHIGDLNLYYLNVRENARLRARTKLRE